MKYALALLFLFSACRPAANEPAAIKDFRGDLQPTLKAIITRGYVRSDDGDTLAHLASADELRRLERGEHPLLRAAAGLALFQRKEVDHFDVIMHHLNDTSLILEDHGEWGLAEKMVSDVLLHSARWKNEVARQETRDSVFLHHTYLEEAITTADIVEPRPEFYRVIKKMALEEGRFGYPDREHALYGLARYKRKEDRPFIRDVLVRYRRLFRAESFRLMRDFPDTTYLKVFRRFYPGLFYRCICQDGVTSVAGDFIEAIAVYKSDSSARILSTIFDKRPFLPCQGDSSDIIYKLLDAVWNNPCPAYLPLKKRMITAKKEMDKLVLRVDVDTSLLTPAHDTTTEPIRWW